MHEHKIYYFFTQGHFFTSHRPKSKLIDAPQKQYFLSSNLTRASVSQFMYVGINPSHKNWNLIIQFWYVIKIEIVSLKYKVIFLLLLPLGTAMSSMSTIHYVIPFLWLILLLLFSWPQACALLLTHEVVMFQPRSGTATSLGSIAIVASYLIPVPQFDCFLGLSPSPSVSQLPLPPATLWRSFTALCTRFSALVPVLKLLAKQAPIPTVLRRPSCTNCLAAFGLLPRSLSVPVASRREPVSVASSPIWSSSFFALDVDSNSPVNPCGLSLLICVLPPPFIELPPPPASLDCRPGPFQSWGVVVSPVLASYPPPSFLFFPCPCAAPYLDVLWGLSSLSRRPFARFWEA